MKSRRQAGIAGPVSVKMREPDKTPDDEITADISASEAIEYCMGDLIEAISKGDKKGAAQAFQDAFSVLEAMPHQESE